MHLHTVCDVEVHAPFVVCSCVVESHSVHAKHVGFALVPV